ncbi:hydroxyisourate hydrolase [Polluticaenibacter yanchengensis]|uniref:5-hydroxyisourate hydrolase n=1 Tax=Polluticaenibacter yanchengensis TaxID=3014562 RepID=A0ABT4UMY7_9BACT|nr:hydroxyisourate hydrolase [Chitinophagaceae bacterium LY-5]
MSSISTHILDTTIGKPAANVAVSLWQQKNTGWYKIADGNTDNDGRVKASWADITIEKGLYKMYFQVDTYFESLAVESFYPFVEVVFRVDESVSHYHVPLLLNPFGYSTYRGS